ncbi:MAG: hypothetical protein SGBAC_012635 [Bacillariaceae sp.]
MSFQEKRALRLKQERNRFCKMKILVPLLVIFGYVISTTNLSLSQQVVFMESLMSTTTVGRSTSGITDQSVGNNPIKSTEKPVEYEDSQVDEDSNVGEAAATIVPTNYSDNDEAREAAADDTEKEADTQSDANDDLQCAICFFGLPRSYKELVLPSIVKNVLEPNAKYNCDIFVHFYARKKELKGRLNPGGEMDPTEIYDLESAVQEMAKSKASSPQDVIFSNDTEKTFFDVRRKQIDKYLKTKDDKTGKKLYFPWKQKTWKRSSLVNLIRQWHSIENVFGQMESHMEKMGEKKKYTRVAMLRNDAMYLSPIDILKLDNDENNNETGNVNDQSKNVDVNNQHFVIAPFANYPVNDRMVYGPYDAIKIWATQRFNLVEGRAKKSANRGMVMHSETFMQQTILPAMESLGYKQHVHPGLCFIRTRPDSKALFNDCRTMGTAKGFENRSVIVSEMESILGRSCEPTLGQKGKRANHVIQC